MVAGLALLLAAAAAAQPTPGDLDAEFRAAIAQLGAGQADEAIDRLEEILEQEPAYVAGAEGGAAYWLSRAYAAAGDPESAYEVLLEGLDALDTAGRFDPRLAAAVVRATFDRGHGAAYERAGRAYLQFLESLDQLPVAEETVQEMADHFAALALVAPEAVQQETGLDEFERRGRAAFKPGAGARLAAWWRSRDVAPATRRNERVEEHLGRIAHARVHYRAQEGGFDDRGAVYIRLGSPSSQTHVPFENMSFRNKVIDRNLTLSSSDFYENEFWVYKHVDDTAYFLFINKTGSFRLGEVRDLVPSVLSRAVGSSDRGQQKARAAIRTLEEIYRTLSLHHPDFGARYNDVAAFVSMLDENEIAASTARLARADDEAVDAEGDTPSADQAAIEALAAPDYSTVALPGGSFPPSRPDLFASHILAAGHVEDEQAALRREDYVPRDYSNVFDELEPLDIGTRLARFLDDDGTTRTEIYWSASTRALQPSKKAERQLRSSGIAGDAYLLMTSVVQKAPDFRERAVHHNRHVVPRVDGDEPAALVPQTYTVRGDTGLYHLALQWDQYTVRLDAEGRPMSLGEALKVYTFRADSLRALSADEAALEMSDLKPLLITNESLPIEEALPYPAETFAREAPPALYFEVYHLAFGADDRTHYRVEYEVNREERKGVRGLLRRGGDGRTVASTEYEGEQRTAREHIVLDLGDWSPGPLDVTVRVTDLTTGQKVARTLSYELQK